MPQSLQAAAARLENWIKDKALPLWSSRGIDPLTGISYERLTASGDVDYAADIRVRVQARQTFFFAAAYNRGWCPEGREIAERMSAWVKENASHPTATAGYTHLLNAQLKIIDDKQDLYDHAFFILAGAWRYRAFGDHAALQEVEQLVAYLDNRFGSNCGGWIEGDYAYSCRRQNPHMHLFEAFLALYDATGNAKWLARVGEIFGLFQSRFFDAERGLLLEFFNEDWTPLADERGRVVEPGHMFEWVWLLDWYHRRSGRPVSRYIDVLYNNAMALGVDHSGLPFDAINTEGEPLDRNKRCWGLTELIKASLVQIRAGHPDAEKNAIAGIDALFDYYLCAPTEGAYIDRRGANDDIVVDLAPASTLYHIIVAAMELIDHCEDTVL